MLILGRLVACIQLVCILRVDLVYGYYRQQRKLIEEIDWSYTGTLNQKNWGKKYSACNGAKQSPINIDEDLTQVNVNLKKLKFHGWEKETLEDTFIRNTGKTVEINLTNDYYVSGGGLDTIFKASKITFHWGKCNVSSDGSEHSLEGQKFPLEMQIYCYDADQFTNFEEAIKGNGKLRALSILFEIGVEDNPDYNPIINGVDSVSRFGKQAALEPFILLNLLPNATDKYYTYNGSLSTPPCSETVEWIVFKDTISISEDQLAVFCEVLTMQQSGYVMLMDYLQNNFREQQYKFFGQVFSSYTGQEEIHEAVCSSEPENVQSDPKNYTSLLVTWERPRVVYDTTIERFAVFYQQLDGEDQTKHEFLTDGYQDLGAILNNLLPNTSYVLQIVAVCSNGLYGKYSDQVIVDMPLEDPEADLIPELNETEEYEDEVDEKETEVDEETAVIPSTDSTINQIRKDFQVTTSSYSQEKMGTKPNEAKTNRYLTREEELHGKDDVFKAVYYPTSPPASEISEEEEDPFLESRTITGIPPQLIDSTKGVEEEYIYLSSGTEPTRITTTGHSDEGFLLSPFKPHQESDDSWSSVLTTSSAQLVTEETSQEDTLPSGSPDISMHDVLSQGSIKYVSEGVAPSSSDEPPKHASSTDGNVWFRNATDLTTQSVDTSDSRQLSQTSYTDAYVEGLKPATVPYSSSPVVSQDTSDADLELPHYSTFAFSSAELSPHSISSSSGEYGSASAASEVLSQTTQPVYNGEIPLQPSYSSEVFPLVTPLLFDSQMLDTTPATSDSDVTLHATPVFPSVDVSFEPTLSSSDDVPLLTFSSASSSSKMFHRLYTVSQMFPQSATPAVASDKVSLHASLTLAEGDTLIQPSLAQYADVVSHQTTHAASETLIFGHNRTHIFSQVEPSSSDLNMHVLSTMSELPYALSSHVGSLQSFTVSYDSAEFVHDSVDVFRQDPLFSSYNNVLVHKTSSVISQADTLLQPTRSLSSDMDWSEAYSGSESLLPDTDTLMVLNISSSDSVDEITYESSGFSDVNKMLQKGDVIYGDERELQISSSLSEMASNAESKVIPELSTSVSNNDVIKQNTSLQESPLPVSSTKGILPVSLAFPTTKIFDHDISKLTENHLSVQPLHVTTPAFDDTLLKPMLSASSDQALSAPAYSKMLSSTQPYFYETSATLNNEALLQSSFQSSGDGTLLNTAAVVPSDPILAESSRVHKDSSTFDQILHQMAPGSATTETMLHSTSTPSVADMLPNTFSKPTASLQGLSVSYASEEYVSSSLFNSEDVQQVMPTLYSSDISFQLTSLENTNAFPPQAANAMTTPFLTGDTLPHIATPADSHISSSVFERSEAASVSSSSTLGFDPDHMPAVVSDSDVSIHHTLPLPNVHISVTAVPPKSEIPVTLSRLLVPSRESSGLSPSIMSSTDLWPSVVEDDYDEYDDGFPVSNCISCTSHREAQDMVVEEQNTKVNNNKDQSNLIISSHSEKPEEEEKISTAASDSQINHAMDRRNYTSVPTLTASVIPKKHNEATVLESHIQTASVPLQNTSESKSWAVFTSDEESGSGQGTSDSLNDNETSTDFSFPDLNERDTEGAVEAGNSELTPGSSQSSASSVTSDHSSVFNISEAEASNSSHESRIGLAESLESEKKTVIPLVVVSALTFICLVILVGILIYWRKCFQTAHFYLEDNTSPRVISAPPAPIFPVSDDVGAIPIKHFPKHVADLHASNGFSEEFEEIQSCTVDLGITSDSSNHPDNKNKNRYINIVAYDHTRVKLAQLAEKDGKLTDYINANYVDGYNKPKAYIAAQGPLKSTAEDFWRMIWEHNVEVIVMITNLVEKGRRKCDQYWPAEGSEEYGNFLVTQKSVHVLAYYTVRNFTLRNTKIKKGSQKGRSSGRIVTQYHYTQWPDMGVPEYTLPVLTFVRKASHAKRHAVGPVVVHCSAGVGRTGTYIVLDSMLQQIQHEGTVNIFGFLKHIRTQRNYLVQTEEQYIFIHDALVEAILSKETEVLETHIHAYVNALLIPGPTGKTRLEKQFKLLSQSNTQQCDYSTALKQCNREKNRTSSIIPVERSRVGISSLSGEGTDYINASYIMGYYQSNEFIITQHPLLHTIKDFWRMIWDHNAQLIVMLPDSQNMAEDEFVYWPNKDEPINCESFKVTMIAEEHKCLSNEEKLIIQDFILEATQDDYVLEVRHFQCPKWPNPDSPISKTFELISIIKEETSNRDGPMIVHDEHGGVTAGTFCALTTLMHQLENENSVDVYQVAKMINLMRPGVFTDIEQYQFLYKAILSLVSTRQEENPSASMDSNGSALPDGNAAESLESLV
ncbi:receptor-type tyrosine-protein phosphatase zeta isoform X3 [Accipiter gentilis]|uniref:receptor-type tyrosine-protein phosphatase zeta isoform X3 n=1 Tax=Astur gentilis TaxID=8957 RepID=UPI0021108EDC|nr:receptor-type tyrosine-protein phosphatase zeta isoform X3 [Accipiter gentilis]